ncbi:hypothetical protein [Halopelagius fulvigenes]|uniref:PH domain-containing protein n=1 Tax=Halopelagius fulvigenes TaxID=1198324 RepID=A0ABD5TTF9_9EURY
MVPPTGERAGPPSPSVVSWERPSPTRLRTAVRHAVAGFFAAVLLFVFVLLGIVAYGSLTGESPDSLVVLVTLLLVGGPFSLLYLVTAHGGGDLSDLLPYDLNLRPRYLLLSTPFCAGVLATATRVPVVFPALFVGLFVAWVVAVARESAGDVSVEEGSLRVLSGPKPRPYDVRTLRAHESWSLGSMRVVRLRYAGSMSLSRPSFVFVPESDFPAVEGALSEIESRDYGLDPSETSRAAKAALVAFGLLFFGLAGTVALLASRRGDAELAASSVAILGMFGVVFWVLAWAS